MPEDGRYFFEKLAQDNADERDIIPVEGVDSEALADLTSKVDHLLLS